MQGGPLSEFPSIDDFFSDVIVLLAGLSAYREFIEWPMVDTFGLDVGILKAAIGYQDGSQLHIDLAMDYSESYPKWQHYSFHYQGADEKCIFRYDNERHYPDLPFFPSHKHVGPLEEVQPCSQPSVRVVCSEIEALLSRAPGTP